MLTKQKSYLELNFEREKLLPHKVLAEKIDNTAKKLKYFEENKAKWTSEKYSEIMSEVEFKNEAIQANMAFLLGAIGENKAATELKKLPDTYTIINDFRYKFNKPLHHKQNNDWIYTIQIDHIVVGPTGIFLIETKNWSKESLVRENLYSPVKQMYRSGYALFVLINDAIRHGELPELSGGWGNQKISPKSILLMVGAIPNQKFQFIDIIHLNELILCITSSRQMFSMNGVSEMSDYLVNISNSVFMGTHNVSQAENNIGRQKQQDLMIDAISFGESNDLDEDWSNKRTESRKLFIPIMLLLIGLALVRGSLWLFTTILICSGLYYLYKKKT